jgi:hypothetical protein
MTSASGLGSWTSFHPIRMSTSVTRIPFHWGSMIKRSIILIVVPPCILISTNYFFQRMHRLLKHKILQFVFKCYTWPLHVSVPLDHLQGAHIRTLLKLLKLQLFLHILLNQIAAFVLSNFSLMFLYLFQSFACWASMILIVVPPCILITTNHFFQRMHCLLKHKILQFVFKCLT